MVQKSKAATKPKVEEPKVEPKSAMTVDGTPTGRSMAEHEGSEPKHEMAEDEAPTIQGVEAKPTAVFTNEQKAMLAALPANLRASVEEELRGFAPELPPSPKSPKYTDQRSIEAFYYNDLRLKMEMMEGSLTARQAKVNDYQLFEAFLPEHLRENMEEQFGLFNSWKLRNPKKSRR